MQGMVVSMRVVPTSKELRRTANTPAERRERHLHLAFKIAI
jgi:hypothetical protein